MFNALSRVAVALLFLAVSSPARAEQTVGLFLNDPASHDGYTLFAPQTSNTTYLISDDGKFLHSWGSAYTPGNSVYLLESGSLLRTGEYAPSGVTRFGVGGKGGRVEEFLWDGPQTWDFVYSDAVKRQHHDIEPLPNGNVLMVAWELKSTAEAVAAGRDPSLLNDLELWPDHIIEVRPTGPSAGEIVWEWHAWDHLIQDFDPARDNYGVVENHPELIDLNFLGLTGPAAGNADWLHVNAVDYNAELDQIVLSVHHFGEMWVIDHSTNTAEAAGHAGGNSGKGGDLLYRWGNPQAYRQGEAADQMLFGQHDAQWIAPGLPGEGNLLVFNNGGGRPDGAYSSLDEIVPPINEQGLYDLVPGSAYGPAAASWTYTATPPTDFYAQNISGAQRLPNGNTLACDGPQGTFFEVTPSMTTVWRYVNPLSDGVPLWQGAAAVRNRVFRASRYGPDYSAFDGKVLTSFDSLELHDRPIPVPDGAVATQPVLCERVTAAGDWIHLEWDAASCQAHAYNLIYGDLANIADLTPQGAECGIGVGGSYDWQSVPMGDLFFLVVGVDDSGLYESNWGADGAGVERSPASSSWMCGVTTKDAAETCP